MTTHPLPASAPLRVLFIASEADPFNKVGGLGDVTGSLPRALMDLPPALTGGRAMDVRLAIPFHRAIRNKVQDPQHLLDFQVKRKRVKVKGSLYQVTVNGVPVYLVDGEPIASEETVYSLDTARDGERYTFFSLGILEAMRALNWQPHILHAHDWHTAMAVYWLNLHREDPFYSATRSIITIHNLPFLGGGTSESLSAYGLHPTADEALPEWARHFPLPLGLLAADHISTVSPTYAREILTVEFGSGLQKFLKTRKKETTGILNGLDTAAWDPANDHAIARPFSHDQLEERRANRQALLSEFNLDLDPSIPLMILISRMDPQKGVDIALKALDACTDRAWQIIMLGSGIPALEEAAAAFAYQHKNRARAVIRFDAGLARRMYAGADMLLMPSRYEPCGLAQMISMRYGCLPLARATGGLKDSIVDGDPQHATGFLFVPAHPDAMEQTLRRALALYPNRIAWTNMQRNAMRLDFSWQRSAQEYARMYCGVLSATRKSQLINPANGA